MRLLALPAWLLVCAVAMAQQAPLFSVSTITGPVPGPQTVLPGHFREGDLADVFIVAADADGRRRGRYYEQRVEGEFAESPSHVVDIDPEAVVVDVGRLGDRDAIVWLTTAGVIQFDPLTDTVRRLARGISIYAAPAETGLPRIDFFRDINGDELDDLVIPDFNGYRVHVQRADGSFGAAAVMTAPPVMDMSFDNHPWYQPQPLFQADMDGDGRVDAVVWNEDHFRVYRLLETGSFDNEPVSVSSNVPFEIVGTDSISARLREEDQSELTLRALYDLRDLTGDGIPELVTLTIVSSGVFKKETTYRIHRGIPPASMDGGDVTFSEEPMSVIASRGIQFETEGVDVDADSDIDLVISSVRIGIGKIVGALLTGSVSFDLDFYPLGANGYADGPSVSRQITATFDLSSGDFFYPFVLITDVTGDGPADLLVQDGEDTLQVFRGTGDETLFERSPVDVKLELPNDADLVQLADLNRDGRSDVVMRIENKKAPGRVSLLVSRP